MDSFKIRFEKVDLSDLIKDHTVVDMHFHTRYSDGKNSIGAIVQRLKKLGIGVAITDHNEIRGAVEINRHSEILSIPGIEITSQEGSHLLVYFYHIKELIQFYSQDVVPFMGNKLMSSLSLKVIDIIERSQKYKAICIFPHPYCAAYTGIQNLNFSNAQKQRMLDLIDGVEVINGENLQKWNLQCAILGFNLNKIITAGSDGHTISQLGKAVSYAKCPNDRVSFLNAVKKCKNKVIGKEVDILRKMRSNSVKIRANIKNYPNIMEKNFRYSYQMVQNRSTQLRQNINKRFKKKDDTQQE